MPYTLPSLYPPSMLSSLDGCRGVQDGVRQAVGLGKNCEVSRVRVRVTRKSNRGHTRGCWRMSRRRHKGRLPCAVRLLEHSLAISTQEAWRGDLSLYREWGQWMGGAYMGGLGLGSGE